jgi:hypothetical protein
LLAQTQKQNRRQNRGLFAHKGTQTSAVIKLLSVLTKHTGPNSNQLVEPAKDWRSDCLAKRNLVGVELCGVLERLHSMEGLAQSNNNAKLNYSAKHDQMVLDTGVKVEQGLEERLAGRHASESCVMAGWASAPQTDSVRWKTLSYFLFVSPFLFTFPFLLTKTKH